MRRITLALVCLVAFAVPCESALVLPGVGTLARVLGILAALCGVTTVIASGHMRRPGMLFWLMTAFLSWSVLTLFWSVDPGLGLPNTPDAFPHGTWPRIATYAQLWFLAWLIWEFAPTTQAVQLLLQSYVLGAYVTAAATIVASRTGALAAERATSFGFDANDLGVTLALGIPMAWQLMLRQRGWLKRWLNAAYVPAATITVFLTASRGAFLATVVAASIVLWSVANLSLRAKLRTLVLLVAAAGVAYLIVPQSSWDRLAAGRQEITSGTLDYRLIIWREGAQQFLTRPFVGAGAGAFGTTVEQALGRPYVAHNTYLGILVEEGLVGFAIFATICGVVLAQLRRLPSWERRLCVILCLTWAVGAASLSWDHRKPTWLVLGLVAAQLGAATGAGSKRRASPGRRPLVGEAAHTDA